MPLARGDEVDVAASLLRPRPRHRSESRYASWIQKTGVVLEVQRCRSLSRCAHPSCAFDCEGPHQAKLRVSKGRNVDRYVALNSALQNAASGVV